VKGAPNKEQAMVTTPSHQEFDPTVQRFVSDGQHGRKAQTMARAYVYNVLVAMLDNEPNEPEGWMFGGIENEFDRRRLTKAIRQVQDELRKKAEKLT
jgi:hypothetical protein